MIRDYKADLHIHTCLSPCGDWMMTPRRIVNEAGKMELDIIGICDHNSMENTPAVVEAGKETVTVLAGMEISSREEVHVLTLFDNVERARELQKIVYENLEGENNEEAFGAQIIMDAGDEITGLNRKLLIGATSLSLEELVDRIHELGGVAVASHIDREGFGIIGQLGFIPPGLELDALEISPALNIGEARKRFTEYGDYPMVSSSDAHYLEDIGKTHTFFKLEEPTLTEIGMALKREKGRSVVN